MIGTDRDAYFHVSLARAASALGIHPERIRIKLRSDDHLTQFAAIRASLGVGFAVGYVIRMTPDVRALPFDVPIPALPVWLAVHREISTNPRIRRVFDALAQSLKATMA